MRTILISFIMMLGLSACASKDVKYYERANSASEKSLNGLEKDTQ